MNKKTSLGDNIVENFHKDILANVTFSVFLLQYCELSLIRARENFAV